MTELQPSTRQLIADLDAWADGNGDDLTIYGEGICYASVCTSLPDDEVDARMAARPTGASHGWARSADATFAGGQPNPCPCDTEPATRRHILFEC